MMNTISPENDQFDVMIAQYYEEVYNAIEKVGVIFFNSNPKMDRVEQMAAAYETMHYFLNEEKYERCAVIKSAIDQYLAGFESMKKNYGLPK